ncbi:hypothetical protein DPMN_014876 [Dreissena polymorpha]|uniref:Uncharacterized protein n=1 Tax=Dreissena polymorpha TaxID=45954 RepID=A0A9D4S534_DREPO|nr:hypothetical protein DPMN_014876 [Dreissena polymorpha]
MFRCIAECLGAHEKVQKAHRMLRELKENRMERRLNPDRIFHYNLHWVGLDGMSGAQRLVVYTFTKPFTALIRILTHL